MKFGRMELESEEKDIFRNKEGQEDRDERTL